MEVEVASTNGLKMKIGVSGFRQTPHLELIEPREIQGRNIAGPISIGTERSIKERGFYARGNVFIRGPKAAEIVEAAIAELPAKVYRIYLGKEVINADGDMIEVPQWTHENGGVPGANKSEVVRMLENAGITEIAVDEAEKMWKARVEEIRKPFVEAAQKAGKPVEMRRGMVECRDPREECSADLAITYMRPDGTTYTEYTHTY